MAAFNLFISINWKKIHDDEMNAPSGLYWIFSKASGIEAIKAALPLIFTVAKICHFAVR
jgi:hypothetical protein